MFCHVVSLSHERLCCQADISSEGDGEAELEYEGECERDIDIECDLDIDIDCEAIIPQSSVAQKYSLKLILAIKAFMLELILCIIIFCIK